MGTESIYPAPFDTSTFIFPAEWQALSDVFGGSSTGLLFLRDGLIVHLNSNLEEQLGFDDVELAGQPIESLLLSEQKADPRHDDEIDRAGGTQAHGTTVRLASKSGKPIDFDLIVNRIDTLSNARYTIWVLQPPSQQAAAEAIRENARAAARLEAIAEHLPDLVLVCAPDTTLRYASRSFAELLGCEGGEPQGLRLADLVHQEDRSGLLTTLEQRAQDARPAPLAITFRIRHRDGSWRYVAAHASNLLAQPDVAGLLLSGRDITEQYLQQRNIDAEKKRQLHYLNRLFGMAQRPHANLASALKVILKAAAKALGTHRCAYWEADEDPAATRCVMAYDDIAQNFVVEATDATFANVFHPLLHQVLLDQRTLAVSDVDQDPRAALSCEYFHATGIKALMTVPVQRADRAAGLLILSHFRQPRSWRKDESDFAGNVAGLVGLILNEVERTRAGTQSRHPAPAHHDDLTGLPNRHFLFDRAGDIFSRAANSAPLAAFFVDLDGFKGVNDALGHATGDELLKAAALRLKNMARKDDILARLDGDKFMLLARKLADIRIIEDIAQQIVETMRTPFSLQGRELQVSTSVGIARYPLDGSDVETLMQKAGQATYRAKSSGRNQYRMSASGPQQCRPR